MLEVNGITGAETLKSSKGLRDVYGSVESHLNYTPGKLPADIKQVVRFEFDKLVSAYTETSEEWRLQGIRQRFGAKDGSAFIKRNASWRNDNVSIKNYPQVISQLTDDVKRFEKHLAEMKAVGNTDGAGKCAGKIRQCKNNIAILSAQYDEFAKQQDIRSEEAGRPKGTADSSVTKLEVEFAEALKGEEVAVS